MSVVIPAYNAADYICDAVRSVLAQSYRNYEIIIVNDGSPDTEEMERRLAPFRDRILYHKQVNGGPSAARNAGIRLARGEYVAFLDSDDQWLPEFLSSQIAFLERHPSLDLVYCDAALAEAGRGRPQTFMQRYPSVGPVTLESLLRGTCVVITSCVVARRAALQRAGLFDESLYFSEDFDLWFRLVHQGGRIGYHRGVLALRRDHPQSLTTQQNRFLRNHIHMLEQAKRNLVLPQSARVLLEERLCRCRAELGVVEGKEKLLAGEYRLAEQEIQSAASYYGTAKLRAAALLLQWWPGLLRAAYLARQHAEGCVRRTRS